MNWSWESIVVQVVILMMTAAAFFYTYITRQYGYWKRKGVFHETPSFPFGSIGDLVMAKIDVGRYYERYYKKFKPHKCGGTLEVSFPNLVVTDLDLIKHILTKDFNYFTDRAVPPQPSYDVLANHLFAMKGKEWKEMRVKLTPTFTSGKMKQMYTLIEKCSDQLKEHLEPSAAKGETLDVKEMMAKFTIDIIATCAFGLEVNTLKDTDTEIFRISQLIFEKSKFYYIKRFFMAVFPSVALLFRMCLTKNEVRDFILNILQTTVSYREKNGVSRNDFLDLLIEVKNNSPNGDSNMMEGTYITFVLSEFQKDLTLREMAAQTVLFFGAGFETAASTMTFTLYELARHPEVQERLRREVDEAREKHGGRITYQAMQEMVYMEQVLNETLRMYVSVPVLFRMSTETYQIPGTDVVLDKDVKISIPTYGIHHDPELYPDPMVFDPERFSEENVRKRHHYAFLPFGEGPRACIAMRFGKMQVKAGLSTIIAHYQLSTTPETPEVIDISPNTFVTTSVHPIRLRFTKRAT